MKASELRIGNLVDWYSKIIKLDGVTESYLTTHDPFDTIDPTQVQPITLTEEWLLKFGFPPESSACKRFWVLDNNLYSITTERINNDAWSFDFVTLKNEAFMLQSIKYVHQLQNLYFALTGEELTVSTPAQE